MSENPVQYHIPGENEHPTLEEMADIATTLYLVVAAQRLAASLGKDTAEIFEEIKAETKLLVDSLSREQISQLLDAVRENEF